MAQNNQGWKAVVSRWLLALLKKLRPEVVPDIQDLQDDFERRISQLTQKHVSKVQELVDLNARNLQQAEQRLKQAHSLAMDTLKAEHQIAIKALRVLVEDKDALLTELTNELRKAHTAQEELQQLAQAAHKQMEELHAINQSLKASMDGKIQVMETQIDGLKQEVMQLLSNIKSAAPDAQSLLKTFLSQKD